MDKKKKKKTIRLNVIKQSKSLKEIMVIYFTEKKFKYSPPKGEMALYAILFNAIRHEEIGLKWI